MAPLAALLKCVKPAENLEMAKQGKRMSLLSIHRTMYMSKSRAENEAGKGLLGISLDAAGGQENFRRRREGMYRAVHCPGGRGISGLLTYASHMMYACERAL